MGMEMNVEKKIMRISRQPFPVQITTDQTQLKNVEYFKYLDSIITHNARCTRKVKSRMAMAKAAFNKKKNLFTSTLDLNLKNKLVKCYIWSIALYGAATWTLQKSGSEIPGKFRKVVLEKDGVHQLHRSFEE
jgi:hypothetical protein